MGAVAWAEGFLDSFGYGGVGEDPLGLKEGLAEGDIVDGLAEAPIKAFECEVYGGDESRAPFGVGIWWKPRPILLAPN